MDPNPAGDVYIPREGFKKYTNLTPGTIELNLTCEHSEAGTGSGTNCG